MSEAGRSDTTHLPGTDLLRYYKNSISYYLYAICKINVPNPCPRLPPRLGKEDGRPSLKLTGDCRKAPAWFAAGEVMISLSKVPFQYDELQTAHTNTHYHHLLGR